ncbi:MAG TPA: YidC/Oxa1 family membrane protein insertase [Solirubrobacterales bacterium]|nr:YidC/Oxa1 family membrane protein insertase [Solirubrobacterales bacterium]
MIPLANILQPLIDVADSVITFLHDDVGLTWGLAIVGLTFITRLVILPLSLKQIRSMRSLQQHAPELKALQEKYKGDKERLQREMMAFYKENQINPLASCWPLLLQLPVFLALYQLLNSQTFKDQVLNNPPEGFLFIPNLTENATGVELAILIILFIGTQMGAGIVMSSRVQDRNQRLIMFGLPFLFAPFVATFPAGLAVYWISTNIWTLGQQWVVMTFWPPPKLPTPEEVAAKRPPPPPPRKKKRRK